MSKLPFVSVIILNHNGKEYIKECVDSVLKTNYPNFEIIIIDNASTDNSFEYLKKLYKKSKKVKIFHLKKQRYFAGGSNLGAKKAKGEKLIFLNSDTKVARNWIKELISLAREHPKYLIQPKILNYYQKNIIDNVGGCYKFPGFGVGKGRGEKDLGQYNRNEKIDYANGTCFLIDKNFFKELNGFDEWYKYFYEDVDLSLRAKKVGGQTWYCYKSTIYHKGSLTIKTQVTKNKVLFNIRKNRLMTVLKNFTGKERLLRLIALVAIYLILAFKEIIFLHTSPVSTKAIYAAFKKKNNELETIIIE